VADYLIVVYAIWSMPAGGMLSTRNIKREEVIRPWHAQAASNRLRTNSPALCLPIAKIRQWRKTCYQPANIPDWFESQVTGKSQTGIVHVANDQADAGSYPDQCCTTQ